MAHTNRGRYAREKQYDKAIAEFSLAIKAQVNDPKNYENRAKAYQLAGKSEEAIGDLLKLTEMRPNDPDAWTDLGRLEIERGKLDAGSTILPGRSIWTDGTLTPRATAGMASLKASMAEGDRRLLQGPGALA